MNTEAKRMSIKDGGPLHPCEVRLTDAGELLGVQTGNAQGIHTGASLRDHFAGCALIGAMATVKGLGDLPKADRTELLDSAAGLLYEIADAMLQARESGQ